MHKSQVWPWMFFFFLKAEIPSFFLSFFLSFFIYLWLCWVFVSVRGLSLVVASGGHSSSRCAGLSLPWPLLLRSTGSRRAGSVVVAHGPSCSVACGIFPDQGSNPCPLHRQADSQPLRHQGSPWMVFDSTYTCATHASIGIQNSFITPENSLNSPSQLIPDSHPPGADTVLFTSLP